MHNQMVHFCDEMVFFPYVHFIQMHMVISIFLNILIGTKIQTNNFIMKRIMWLFIDKKTHLLAVMDFWS
jgi:hypothetical protein